MADRGIIRVVKWGGLVPTLQSFPVIVFAYTCHQNVRFLNFMEILKLKSTDVFYPERDQEQLSTKVSFFVQHYIVNYSLLPTALLVSSLPVLAPLPASMYSLPSLDTCHLVTVLREILLGCVRVRSPQYNFQANDTDIPSIASTIGKAAIVVLVTFSYPLQVHPCRASVDAVLKWRPNSRRSARNSPNGSPARTVPLLTGASAQSVARNDTISELRFAVITTVIIVLSYIVAMTVSSLDKVLAYVGSTGSTSISFILPGLFYYKISAPESIHHQRLQKDEDEDEGGSNTEELSSYASSSWRKTILRKLSLALAIYGIFVMILCLGTNMFFTGGSAH